MYINYKAKLISVYLSCIYLSRYEGKKNNSTASGLDVAMYGKLVIES